jgi:hypothetical protein
MHQLTAGHDTPNSASLIPGRPGLGLQTRFQIDPFHSIVKVVTHCPGELGSRYPTAAQKLADAQDTAVREAADNSETVHLRPFHASMPWRPTAKQSDALGQATAKRPPTPGGDGLGTTFHVGSVETVDRVEGNPELAPAGDRDNAVADDNSATANNHLPHIPNPPTGRPTASKAPSERDAARL